MELRTIQAIDRSLVDKGKQVFSAYGFFYYIIGISSSFSNIWVSVDFQASATQNPPSVVSQVSNINPIGYTGRIIPCFWCQTTHDMNPDIMYLSNTTREKMSYSLTLIQSIALCTQDRYLKLSAHIENEG